MQVKQTGRRLAAWAAAFVLTVTAAASSLAASYPYITQSISQVNLRRSASSTAKVLDSIPAGASVTVKGESGNYYKVEYKGQTGYVVKVYLQTAPEKDPEPTEVPTATGYPYDTVTTAQVNLRKKADVTSEKLLSIPKGAALQVLSISGSFAKVSYKDKTGYVKKDYILVKTIVKLTPTPKPVVVVTPDPVSLSDGYPILEKGSEGAAVRALQAAMVELGFLSGKVDGKFGDSTQKAAAAFQQMNDYPATGVMDANIQAYLYSAKVKNAAGKKVKINTLAPIDDVTIQLNNTGDLVATVQSRLIELGYYVGTVSGTYDKATQAAVKAFQKKNDLKADGICGKATRDKLFGLYGVSAYATATPVPTATPTPAPTMHLPASVVTNGSKGTDALLVQQQLKKLGYYSGTTDGVFGSGSVKALKAFQTANGLKADGTAGSSTYAILFSDNAIPAGVTSTPSPTATPKPAATPAPTALTPQNAVRISLGVMGDAVKSMQLRLGQLGYTVSGTDGLCREADVNAIRAFQKKNGLTADGVAGYDTQSRLYSATAISASGMMAGGNTEQFTTLRRGMKGYEVTQLQKRLIELKYLTGGSDDGDFGLTTMEAVIAFQKANGLAADGVAGTTTLSKLYSVLAVSCPTATPAPARTQKPTATPAPTMQPGSEEDVQVTLRQGDKGEAVRTMQERLIKLGYLTGKADGQFGLQTLKALKEFQLRNGLRNDGIAGAMTLSRLDSVSAISNQGNQNATAAPQQTAAPTKAPSQVISPANVRASMVKYANWYTTIRNVAKKYQYATVYDFSTGISWQVHMFSLGKHADSEPMTATDTANMERAFGGNTWNPKAVWVIMGNGDVYLASTHSMPHEVQHNTANNFNGHLCIHFPRTAEQVAAIGPYATSHQACIDKGWTVTQKMAEN